MERIVFTFLGILAFANCFSQNDSISIPKFFLRPYFENGINFLRNDALKEKYSTQSMYHWGVGIQIGHPEILKAIPYAQFSYSSYITEKRISENNTADSSLTIKQITAGFIIPIKKINKTYVRVKTGYCHSIIKESFYNIDGKANGFELGIGIEKSFVRKSRIYLDLLYNFQKTGKSEFRDFDLIKFSAGIVL